MLMRRNYISFKEVNSMLQTGLLYFRFIGNQNQSTGMIDMLTAWIYHSGLCGITHSLNQIKVIGENKGAHFSDHHFARTTQFEHNSRRHIRANGAAYNY